MLVLTLLQCLLKWSAIRVHSNNAFGHRLDQAQHLGLIYHLIYPLVGREVQPDSGEKVVANPVESAYISEQRYALCNCHRGFLSVRGGGGYSMRCCSHMRWMDGHTGAYLLLPLDVCGYLVVLGSTLYPLQKVS